MWGATKATAVAAAPEKMTEMTPRHRHTREPAPSLPDDMEVEEEGTRKRSDTARAKVSTPEKRSRTDIRSARQGLHFAASTNGGFLPKRNRIKKSTGVRSQNPFKLRLDIKVPMEPCTDEAEALEIFLEGLDEALETISNDSNDDLALIPWCESKQRRLDDVYWNELPQTKRQLLPYLRALKLNTNGSPIYTAVYVAHTSTMDELIEYLEMHQSNPDLGIWPSVLQVEQTIEIGWLMFSHNGMDVTRWSHMIGRECDCDIGLRWRAITKAKDEDGYRISALHVFCDKTEERKARAALAFMYGSEAKTFLHNTKLRLVPSFKGSRSIETEDFLRKAQNTQACFGKNVRKLECAAIGKLDSKHDDAALTLREILMSRMAKAKPTQPVIHSVDYDDYRGVHVATVLPQYAKEAKEYLSGIVVRCKHQHGEAVLDYFNNKAVELARSHQYNAETDTVQTEDDNELRAIILNADDADYNFVADRTETFHLPEDNTHHPLRAAEVADDSTVLSFNTTKRDKQRKRRAHADSNTITLDNDDDDEDDEVDDKILNTPALQPRSTPVGQTQE